MYLLYSALLAAGLLISLPYWMFGKRRHGKYREGLSERLGKVPSRLQNQAAPAIWIHAVSVGEVLAVSAAGGRVAATLSPASGSGFNHHRHRAEAGKESLWRRTRLLLSLGPRVCNPPLSDHP